MKSFLDKLFRRLRLGKIIRYIPNDSVVCDIGCGREAIFLKSISSFIKQGIGLDGKIEDYTDSKFEFRRFKIIDSLPIEKEKCDIVTMVAFLEHLDKPQLILGESFRILKKGGKLILTTPTPLAKSILEFLSFKLRLIDENEIRDHKNYFWPKDIQKMLEENGFEGKNIKSNYFEFFLNGLVVAKKWSRQPIDEYTF